MRRWLVSLVLVAVLGAGGWWAATRRPPAPISGQLTVAQAINSDSAGFKRVTDERAFQFPADHGPHPGYQTEWWYYTGNLDSADGRHWGYQLTFFRRQLTPDPKQRASQWASDALYMAHFAITDVAGKQFYAFDRFSRDGAGLAGAQGDPFRVFLQSWSASGAGDSMRLVAAQGAASLDLTLRNTASPVLQGDRGLSRKGADVGNASYYYSLPRMTTTGVITINGTAYSVNGASWMDREWSTSVLGSNAVGWDWFALQLSDGRALMLYQIRLKDGTSDPYSSGTLIAADGSTEPLKRDDAQIDVLGRWRSPHTGTTYPAQWRLQIPKAGLDLEVQPYLNDQELRLAVTYWEGAARISGTSNGQPLTGQAYVELTGYGDQRPSAVQTR